MKAFVSVIIVNHNGIEFVDSCLRSVFESRYSDFEVIVVDNASTDGSREYIKREFGSDSRLRLVENSGSLGPAVGRNRGARIAKGKHLIFFDNDTRVDKNCINELVAVLENDTSIGAGQAKLLQMDKPDYYDCAGDYFGPLGFLVDRAKRKKDVGQFDKIEDIFNAKSAASIVRKDVFDKAGGFDADFYMYLEETDLSWRIWLAGYRVVFVPRAIVYHAFGGKKKQVKARSYYPKHVVRYYGCRNYITTLIKNLGLRNLSRVLPLHVLSWLTIGFLFFLKGRWQDCYYIIKGVWWNVLNLNIIMQKRILVQNNIRKAADNWIIQKVATHENLSDYLTKTFIYLGT